MSSNDQSLLFEFFFCEENLSRIFDERIRDAKFIGLDGVSASALEENLEDVVATVVMKIHAGRYRFTRFREKLIIKNHRNPRGRSRSQRSETPWCCAHCVTI